MKEVELLVNLDDAYIVDQLIAINLENKKINFSTKQLCVMVEKTGKGGYLYKIEFADVYDVLEFGFDMGKCLVAGDALKQYQHKNKE